MREHGKPELIAGKENEIRNLETYKTFEEVQDVGQESIGSRWIVTRKQQHDGQWKLYKARSKRISGEGATTVRMPHSCQRKLQDAHGFSSKQYFKLVSMDIRAGFLQAKMLDQEVFMKPPEDQKKPGIFWKLKKPLYGLDVASSKFYLKNK